MTSRRPARLNKPSLEAYPFIDVMMFRRSLIGIAHAPFDVKNRSYLDSLFSQNYFPLESISLEQMAPLQAMTTDTLDRLLYILKPTIEGSIIDTKAALDQAAMDAYDSHIDDSIGDRIDNASLDQMVCYQLYKAVLTEPVHWGQMVDLYNNSAADQQEAIHQFFLNNFNRQLDVILATPTHGLMLPESLSKTFESKTENGETLFYSEVEQQWLNEAAFQQIYSVTIKKEGNGHHDMLIAGAPTTDQAIAFATLFTQEMDSKHSGYRIFIGHNNDKIAYAVVAPVGDELSEDVKHKLAWDFKNVGTSTSQAETIRDNLMTQIESCSPRLRQLIEQEHREICRHIHSCLSDTPETFTKAVLSVERALGVQWSKVQMLEDALGL
jgi:hypothetical protein